MQLRKTIGGVGLPLLLSIYRDMYWGTVLCARACSDSRLCCFREGNRTGNPIYLLVLAFISCCKTGIYNYDKSI
jgi:hypothetical protein